MIIKTASEENTTGSFHALRAHRGALAEVEDGGGTFKVVNLPFRMSAAKVAAGRRAASLGEHTVALLCESRLSEERIAAMVGKSPPTERC
jgi:CoA:oxalate CoA-transferase